MNHNAYRSSTECQPPSISAPNGSAFSSVFKGLTGNSPFPWQEALYARFIGEDEGGVPKVTSIPTGLGKTSVLAVWLLALANHPEKMPRRLVYVVNRRTVVDQTTAEAEKLKTAVERGKLAGLDELAISTLRGQFADNGEWYANPARPAIICGTVDMIGSRLLFSGYRIGFKSRPLHTGLLGQDTLLVHDEAHLEPAFQNLVEMIEKEQKKERERCGHVPWRGLQVMTLSATARSRANRNDEAFTLTESDHSHPTVKQRLNAMKTLSLHRCENEKKKLSSDIEELALQYKETSDAILVFLRSVEKAMAVLATLEKALPGQVTALTGTMRGHERDQLVKSDPVFARFLPSGDRPGGPTVAKGTVYLVCTSAGEVGVNLSADHMVCDLSTFDSMAQRLGRVNRFGNRNDTRIDVIHPDENDFDDKKPNPQRKATLELLKRLDGDAGPKALGKLLESLSEEDRDASFAPSPTIPQATDILFDAWAMTTIREDMPGRPPVATYLHGIADWEPPRTSVAWREEVAYIDEALIDRYGEQFSTTLLDEYPLKPHELLSDTTERVHKALSDLVKKGNQDSPVWLVSERGQTKVTKLAKLLAEEKKSVMERLSGSTILLSPTLGGLSKGLLDGKAKHAEDVADEWYENDRQRRIRVWDEDTPPPSMALVRTIDVNPDADEFSPTDVTSDAENEFGQPSRQRRFWHWYVRPKDAENATPASLRPIPWQVHTDDVMRRVAEILNALNLPTDLKESVTLAAELHDLGKRRELWQRSIGNPNPTNWYAKPGKPEGGPRWRPQHISDYRHEFGSLLDMLDKNAEYASRLVDLSEEAQDIVLHLIAAHHGYARPHFPPQQVMDPNYSQSEADEVSVDVMRRYARLQCRFGRWGLAYLESLLRAADWAASAKPTINDAIKEVSV